VTIRDLQRSIVIVDGTLYKRTYIWTQYKRWKNDGFLRLIVITIEKITSTDKEIRYHMYEFVYYTSTLPSLTALALSYRRKSGVLQ
jgi:hypothetical protein